MSSAVATVMRPVPIPAAGVLRSDPAAQAFLLLRVAFTVAPILFGLDKFAGVLTDDWTRYLATQFDDVIPGSAQDAMHLVGVVEEHLPPGPAPDGVERVPLVEQEHVLSARPLELLGHLLCPVAMLADDDVDVVRHHTGGVERVAVLPPV